ADLAISLAQALAVALAWRQHHHGIEITFQPSPVFAPRTLGQIAMAPRQHHRAQQQRLHPRGEHGVTRFDRVLAVTQLMCETHLPTLGVTLLRAVEIGERRVGKECRSRWSPYH